MGFLPHPPKSLRTSFSRGPFSREPRQNFSQDVALEGTWNFSQELVLEGTWTFTQDRILEGTSLFATIELLYLAHLGQLA